MKSYMMYSSRALVGRNSMAAPTAPGKKPVVRAAPMPPRSAPNHRPYGRHGWRFGVFRLYLKAVLPLYILCNRARHSQAEDSDQTILETVGRVAAGAALAAAVSFGVPAVQVYPS